MTALPMDRVREALELAVKEHWAQTEPLARSVEVREQPPQSVKPQSPERSAKRLRPVATSVPIPGPERTRKERRLAPVAERDLVNNRLVTADKTNSQREAYCLLQTAVSRRMAEADFHSLGITSPRSGHGKTLTAINLAISLARDAKQKVLLIDLNLRHPKVCNLFDQKPSAGVEGCLFRGVPLGDALFTASVDGLLILPARGDSQNASQILRSENLRTLLADSRTRYPDHVTVVDLPPLSAPTDAPVFETLVEGLLLVVDDQVTREVDFKRALAAIHKSKLVGTVLNHSRSMG